MNVLEITIDSGTGGRCVCVGGEGGEYHSPGRKHIDKNQHCYYPLLGNRELYKYNGNKFICRR